jgi:hypothetical protein
MDSPEIISLIKKVSGAHEMLHVTTFKGHRENREGKTKALTVEIHSGLGGYHVLATGDDGREALGNVNGNLQAAIPGCALGRSGQGPSRTGIVNRPRTTRSG